MCSGLSPCSTWQTWEDWGHPHRGSCSSSPGLHHDGSFLRIFILTPIFLWVHAEDPQSSCEFCLCLWPPEVICYLTSLHSGFSNWLKILAKFFHQWVCACKQMLESHCSLEVFLFRFQVNWFSCDLSALMGSRNFWICILELFMVVSMRMVLFPASYIIHRLRKSHFINLYLYDFRQAICSLWISLR